MAEATTTSNNKPSMWSDFFGSVVGTIEQTAAEVLPNWTKQQLLEQETDQLESQTFNEVAAAPRVESVQQSAESGPIGAMKMTAFSIGGFNVSYLTIALGFAGLLGVLLVIRARS